MCDDLRDMVRGLERMGLWVRVGDQVGRVRAEDVQLDAAIAEAPAAATPPSTRRVARKAQASAQAKASRLALPAPEGEQG